MAAPSNKFYDKIWVGFCLNNGKRLKPTERTRFF